MVQVKFDPISRSMDTMKINNQIYDYVVDFKDDALLRESFNSLTRKVYGFVFDFDFEDEYLNGYWGHRYIPYSLVNGGTMIAGLFVNVIDFLVLGEKRTYALSYLTLPYKV
jgi:hypothetical protein